MQPVAYAFVLGVWRLCNFAYETRLSCELLLRPVRRYGVCPAVGGVVDAVVVGELIAAEVALKRCTSLEAPLEEGGVTRERGAHGREAVSRAFLRVA